jgi:hypothetical protein
MASQIKWQAIQAMLALQPMEGGFVAGQWKGWRIQRAANEKSLGMLLVFGQPMRKRRNIKEKNRPVGKQ